MKTLQKIVKNIVLLVLISFFLLIACWEFESIDQPEVADPNSSFDVPITVALTEPGRRHSGEGGIGYFGVRLPLGWTVDDSIHFQGIINGTFVYSKDHSDSMETYESSREGYYWWVSVCDSVDSLVNGNISFTPHFTTDNQTGLFSMEYMLSDRIEYFGNYVVQSGPFPISVGLAMSATVTNTNDSGEGSLRQAVADVAMNGKVLFDLTYPATIVLNSQILIDRSISITGPDNGDLVISGNNRNRIIFIEERFTERSNVNISNLSITNGYASGEFPDGGGIYCESSNLYLNNVSINYNSADNDGGGIYSGNSGLYLSHATIKSNSSSRNGGGLYAHNNLTLTNVVIANNEAKDGGGIWCAGENIILTNVTITENSSGMGLYSDGGEISMRNSILWNNLPENICIYNGLIQALYSNIQGGIIGEHIIDTDPLFTDTITYYLSQNSPCIDSGDPDTLFNDWEDSANPGFALWPALGGLRNDMGAYGGHGRFKIIPPDTNHIQFDFPLKVSDESFSFINQSTGWICGSGGIYKTINGGRSWEFIAMQEDVKIIDFVDPSNGWLIGDNNLGRDAVYKSVNGGYSWMKKKDFPYGYDYNSLSAVNDNVMYTVSSGYYEVPYGKIFKTLDGGSHWIDVTQNILGNFWSASFLNSDTGVVSGEIQGNECILMTYDGGLTWDDVYCGSESIHNLNFIDDSSCFFQDGESRSDINLFKTSDTFNSCQIILNNVVSYSAIDKDTIFVITDIQRFLKSTDGGNNWEGTHLGRNFSTIKFVDNSTGWIFGHFANLKTTDRGNTWIYIASAPVTGIKQDDINSSQLPIQFKLSQNFPNPFNSSTTIKYQITKLSQVDLSIYNILGQKVATLVSEKQVAGSYKTEWDASGFASGVYFYKLETDQGYLKTRKLVLLK